MWPSDPPVAIKKSPVGQVKRRVFSGGRSWGILQRRCQRHPAALAGCDRCRCPSARAPARPRPRRTKRQTSTAATVRLPLCSRIGQLHHTAPSETCERIAGDEGRTPTPFSGENISAFRPSSASARRARLNSVRMQPIDSLFFHARVQARVTWATRAAIAPRVGPGATTMRAPSTSRRRMFCAPGVLVGRRRSPDWSPCRSTPREIT